MIAEQTGSVPATLARPPYFNAQLAAWFAFLSMLPVAGHVLTGDVSVATCFSTGGFACLLALTMWAWRLRRAGWSLLWTSGAVCALSTVIMMGSATSADAGAVGGAVFLFALLSLLSAYEKQPNLQALAAAALLLSGGVLTKPPVAISCVLISVTFWLLHSRRTASGGLGLALLMFTPAVLCIGSAVLLTLATGGLVTASAAIQSGTLAQESRLVSSVSAAIPAHADFSLPKLSWLILPAALSLLRICLRRASVCDCALAFMLVVVSVIGSFPAIPHIPASDGFYLVVGGSAALIALTGCTRSMDRFSMLATLLIAGYYSFR